jgi:Rrf2 family nitric oxide-sensitive transcriptional repressor
MHLTVRSNHAMRLLMYCALNGNQLATVSDIARACAMSETHLAKIAHTLAGLGYIETVRGRRGGVKLARPPEEINVGAVLRGTEMGACLMECLDPETNTCPLTAACRLRGVLRSAMAAFLAVLDRYTLADLTQDSDDLRGLMGLRSQGADSEILYIREG